jgi:hypothetical protein
MDFMSYSWETIFWLGDIDTADHEITGPSRLLEQYKNKPRIEAFLGAFLTEMQRLEDLTVQVLVGRSVFTSEGVQLDALGVIVAQPRSALLDEEYRLFLFGKIFANKSKGKWPEFFELMNLIDVDTIQAYEWDYRTMSLVCTGVDYPTPTGRLVLQMKPGGVYMEFIFSTYDNSDVFKISNILGSDETSITEGTAPPDESTGGKIAGMVWG